MSKKIKNSLVIILTFILIFINNNKIQAANANFSVNKSGISIKKGESTSFNITATDCGGQFDISSSDTSIVTVSSNQEWIENTSKSITVEAKKAGNAVITITAKDVATTDGQQEITGSKSISVTVSEEAINSGSTGNTEGTSTPTSKSTEAKLSDFGIKPKEYDFKGFKKDTYTYTHEVPNSVSEVTVYAEPVKGATVTSGTGKVALKEGESKKIEVVVKAEAGNTQKYTLTIKRRTAAEEAALSGEASDATLKSLGIKPEEYDFSGFQKDKTEYSVEVPEDVEEIEVYAEASSSKAQVSGTGKVKLKNGENKLIVQVTAEDGTTRTYTIKVTRGGADAAATSDADNGFGLSSLEIKGLTLNPSFETGVYEYTIELTEDLSSLDIEAIATDEDATIEIIGNENLQQGENTITILVRNEETDETATYQIMVNKNVTAEEEMSWLKPSTWGREEIIKVAIIAVLIILIIIAIILKVKIAKEKKSDEDFDLPGGEELDKALAEHQELEETAEFEKIEMPEERNKTEEMTEIGNVETSEGVDQIEENEISKGVSDLDGTNYIEDIARSKNYKLDYQDDNFNNSGSRKKGKHF